MSAAGPERTRSLFRLYDAVQRGLAASLQHQLTTTKVDINVILPCKGIGILHLAVGIEPIQSSMECTEVILKHGGDPNICSEDGMTPVHIAAIWGRLENLRMLTASGGDPMRRDEDGLTAYDYAKQEQQWAVYDYLRNILDVDDSITNDCRYEKNEELSDVNCSYRLQLDRVLVSTGHIVAEYGTVSEDQLKNVSVCRKSEMIREWCEQTTQAVNRLYPTILNQTYLIQDETVPWKPGDFTRDFSANISKFDQNDKKTDITGFNKDINTRKSEFTSPNDTKTSYKSCFSKKISPGKLGISGIQILDNTKSEEDPNCNCACHETHSIPDGCPKRISIYENFSLPGSPTNITHINYKSKTNLKNKNNTKSIDKLNNCKAKTTDKSLIKSDRSNIDNTDLVTDDKDEFYVDYKSLNDALAMVQNETNEWLSHSGSSNDSDAHLTTDEVIEINDSNDINPAELNRNATQDIRISYDKEVNITEDERRLSHSSGVGSNSSGSIAIANVQEEYKYEDPEEDVVLIEKRLIVPSVVLPVEDSDNISPEESRHSIASSLPASIEYDADRLRSELTACGFTPGPINSGTKRLYLRKLKNLKRTPIVVKTAQGRTYSVELEKSLRNDTWFNDLSPYMDLENKAKADFANPNNARSWREGTTKTSFTYLLLDPRMTDNLPVKSGTQEKHATWNTFVNSVFYVGKGKRSRPYSHLYQALTLWKRDFKTSNNKKVQHILDIWSDQVGVICLHVFQNIIPAEAYTYEASMIDVLGLNNLKNLKCGNYYGVAAAWPLKERRMLGLYLLYKAMLIFLSEGERQLRPGDID